MVAIVQHLTSSGYGYVDTHVERARKMVPLLDTTVKRIEPYINPTILTADKYIDAAYSTAEVQVMALHDKQVALKGKVSNLGVAASARFHAVGSGFHSMLVGLVDRSDGLVDRLLPPDEAEKKASDQHVNADAGASTLALIPRSLSIAYKIPLRSTRIVFVKAGGLAEAVSHKIVTISEPGIVALRSSRDAVSKKMFILWHSVVDGKQAIAVWIAGRWYVVISSLHLPELKDWTLAKVDGLKQGSGVILTKIGMKKAVEKEGAYKAVVARSAARKSA